MLKTWPFGEPWGNLDLETVGGEGVAIGEGWRPPSNILNWYTVDYVIVSTEDLAIWGALRQP